MEKVLYMDIIHTKIISGMNNVANALVAKIKSHNIIISIIEQMVESIM